MVKPSITYGYLRLLLPEQAWSFRFSEGAHEWKRVIRVGWSEIEAVNGIATLAFPPFLPDNPLWGPPTKEYRVETDPPIDHSELAKVVMLSHQVTELALS